MNLKYLFLTFALFSNLSCYSYRASFKKHGKTDTAIRGQEDLHRNRKRAFVTFTRGAGKEEYLILKHSGIFDLVDDRASADVRIVLHRMHRRLASGMATIITIFSLGQIPISTPDRYYLSFDEIHEVKETKERKWPPLKIKREFEIVVKKRIWFWDIFSRRKDYRVEAAKALKWQYKNKQYRSFEYR